MDQLIIDAVLEARPFESKEEFYQFVSEQTGFMTMAELQQEIPPTLVGVSSQFFALHTLVSISGIDLSMTSKLQRLGGSQVRVLSRQLEYLPKLELREDQLSPIQSPCYQTEPQFPGI